MANKRLNDLPEETDPAADDYIAVDGATTRKSKRSSVLGTNLEAIRGLTSAADKGIQFSGSGAAAVYDLTTAGKALLDDADAAAQRTTMGVAIGIDVQAYDADLAALAGLTSAADKLPYFSGSATAALADFTTFGRSLVDDTDASSARTTLGLGTAATTAATDYATAAQGALADSAVQPGDLGALASKGAIAVPADITATGTPSATTYLRGDGTWAPPAGGGISGGAVATAADRAALEALNTTDFSTAFLTESGREGGFVWDGADLSAGVAIDTAQGTYVAPTSDATGASGAWLRYRPRGDLHKVSEYGGDLAAACAVAGINGGTVELSKGTTVLSAALLIPANVSLVGHGSDLSTIDVHTLTSGQLTTDLYAVKKYGAGLTDLGAFNTVSFGSEYIDFTTAPDVAVGDIICIQDTAVGSFLGKVDGVAGRDYYYRGERNRVVKITESGTRLYLATPLRDSYAGGGTVVIYRQSSTRGQVSGLTFDARGYVTAENRIFRARYGDNLRFNDVNALGGAYACFEVDQCMNTVLDGGRFISDIATASSNSYPLVAMNSDHTIFRNFTARGKWNGVSTGADDLPGAVQNYHTVFEDFYASGIDAPGVDIHGNTDRLWANRGFIENGCDFGGKNIYYKDCDVTDKDYDYVLYFAEIYGGDLNFEGGALRIYKPTGSQGANISGASGSAFRAAKAAVNIKIHTEVFASQATGLGYFILDSATQHVNFDFDLKLIGVSSIHSPAIDVKKDISGLNGEFSRCNISGLASGVTPIRYIGAYPSVYPADSSAPFAQKTIVPDSSAYSADLAGCSMVFFSAASASIVTAFTNVIPGKLYTFIFTNGNTTFTRDGAYLIGGANITFASGTMALFVGSNATTLRQVTAATTAT